MTGEEEEEKVTGGGLPPVMLSAIQHYAYCPRQCALIHMEQQFADNLSTQRGNAVHRLVDEAEEIVEKGVLVDCALPLYSHIHGLIGKADVVEWRGKIPYPVEYKRGPRKARRADELQLAAQAICLEEMTGQAVPEGAIFHHASRRRRSVPITAALKEEVVRIAQAIRALHGQAHLPPAVNDSRCDNCSLYDICQPQAIADDHRIMRHLNQLFSPEDNEP